MKYKLTKKVITSFVVVALLISALVYNILYINKKKDEIFDEIEGVEEIEEETEVKTIFVDVGGEVNNPGIYELPENSRINDAITIAGGITNQADLTDINLAYILLDAMKIVVPKKEAKKVSSNSTVKSISKLVTSEISLSNSGEQATDTIININIATKEQLKTLNGIGEATAQKIIDYRNEKGKFENIEAIKNVSGIGESKFDKIKNKITI